VVSELPVAVLVVRDDDPDAPGGSASLRELGGRSLLGRAVGSLVRGGAVGRIVVLVPPELVDVVGALLDRERGTAQLDVLPSAAGAVGLLAAPWLVDEEIVLVHDPLHPLASDALVRAVVEALVDDPDAVGAVPLGPVTDTVKWVDQNGRVTGTADRNALRTVHSPQGYRLAPLLAALTLAVAADVGADALAGLVQAAGGRLRAVPAPAQALRVASADDLVLAEAVLGGA
jgi:2-C-methyl-D-erythritol 4-phosphate cytidylyltransferase